MREESKHLNPRVYTYVKSSEMTVVLTREKSNHSHPWVVEDEPVCETGGVQQTEGGQETAWHHLHCPAQRLEQHNTTCTHCHFTNLSTHTLSQLSTPASSTYQQLEQKPQENVRWINGCLKHSILSYSHTKSWNTLHFQIFCKSTLLPKRCNLECWLCTHAPSRLWLWL
jgi:hypothetical protein